MASSGDEDEEMDSSASSSSSPHPGFGSPRTHTQEAMEPHRKRATPKIHVTLTNASLWQEFHSVGTEMYVNKVGRRMFPFCSYELTGLDPHRLYFLILTFPPVDEYRYRWGAKGWIRVSTNQEHEAGGDIFTHPSSPAPGSRWMQPPVRFSTVKLTNDASNEDGMVVLQSSHRYIPLLHVVPFDPSMGNTVDIDDPETQTFMFPETEFYAVTCYQNPRCSRLKIQHNPFASNQRRESVPPGGAQERSVLHGGGMKRAKKRRSLLAAGQGASPALKKKPNQARGLVCDETMFTSSSSAASSSEEENGCQDEDYNPLNATNRISCSQKQAPTRLTSGPSSSKVSAPLVPKRGRGRPRKRQPPVPLKPLKTPPSKSSINAVAMPGAAMTSTVAMATVSEPEPSEVLRELAVDDVEGLLFVSFPTKESHDVHMPLRRETPPPPPSLSMQPSSPPPRSSSPPPPPPSSLPVPSPTPPLVPALPPPSSPPPPPPLLFPSAPSSPALPPPAVPPALLPPLSSSTSSPSPKRPPNRQGQLVAMATEPEPEEATEGPEALLESIEQLEEALLSDLRSYKYRQLVHPALDQVGLKLSAVDPKLAIDLQYLGVTLPPPPPPSLSPSPGPSTGRAVAFVSRTGKTNDPTKIKGWREKYSTLSDASPTAQEGLVKVSSAFSSEMLDKYLETEAKRISERAAVFATSGSAHPPAAYQLPSRGSSYVRTLDSVLKNRTNTTSSASTSSTLDSVLKNRPDTNNITFSATTAAATSTLSSVFRPSPTYVSPHVSSSAPPRTYPEGLTSRLLKLKTFKHGGSLGARGHVSFSKPQCHLQAMERHALGQGHLETYVTVERAAIAVSVLLTAQGSLAVDRVDWTRGVQLSTCQRACCRLGCVCVSLQREPRGPTNCRRPQCMFECVCFRHRMLLVRPRPRDTTGDGTPRATQEGSSDEDPKLLAYPICDPSKGPRPSPGRRLRVLWGGEGDPEPMFRPQSPTRVTLPPLSSKPANKPPPKSRRSEVEKDSPVYMYFDSLMTCARVRAINSPPPPQVPPPPGVIPSTAKEGNTPSSATQVKKSIASKSHKSEPAKEEACGQEEDAPPTKMLSILSECDWQPHRKLLLSALSRRISRDLLTASFSLGMYRLQLLSTTRQQHPDDGCTITYTVSIGRHKQQATANKPPPPPPQTPPPPKPARTSGYLRASCLAPGVAPSRAVEVNGKRYSKAQIMLGRMGSLNPANRLAAFVTGKLVTFSETESTQKPQAATKKRTNTPRTYTPRAAASKTTGAQCPPVKLSKDPTSVGKQATLDPASVGKQAPAPTPAPPADAPPPLGPNACSYRYIPIGSPAGTSPLLPLNLDPAAATTPAQKVMLAPIGSTPKGALYRHPSGQLVQLIPTGPPPPPGPGVGGTMNRNLYRQANGQMFKLVPFRSFKAISPKPPGAPFPKPRPVLPPAPNTSASGPSSSAPQEGSTDTLPPTPSEPSAVVVSAASRPFSLSGKSTICISQGAATVKSLPGAMSFSFRICPPSQQPKASASDTQQDHQNQNLPQTTGSSLPLPLPGGYTLIPLPVGGGRNVVAPVVTPVSPPPSDTPVSPPPSDTPVSPPPSDTPVSPPPQDTPVPPLRDTPVPPPPPDNLAPRRVVAPVVCPPLPPRSISPASRVKETPVRPQRDTPVPHLLDTPVALPLSSDSPHTTTARGSQLAGTSSQDTQRPKTSVDRNRKFASGVVVPTRASASPRHTISRADEDCVMLPPAGKRGRKVLAPMVFPPTISKWGALERKRRLVEAISFVKLQEALHISKLNATKQDVLDQARLVIGGLKQRDKELERKKSALTETQAAYIQKIARITGRSEEVIRKRLMETSRRQHLLGQHRRQRWHRLGQQHLSAKECDWLTERLGIWSSHGGKRETAQRKQLLSAADTSTASNPKTGEGSTASNPKTSNGSTASNPNTRERQRSESDWLTKRFGVWNKQRRERRRRRKELLSPPSTSEDEATANPKTAEGSAAENPKAEEGSAMGSPKTGVWRSGIKARDSPELRAALLTPANSASQVGSSSPQSSPGNSGTQGQQPTPGRMDTSKLMSLLSKLTTKLKQHITSKDSTQAGVSQSSQSDALLLPPDCENGDTKARSSTATDKSSTEDASTSSVEKHVGKIPSGPLSHGDVKGRRQGVEGGDDVSKSLAKDAGNVSPSGSVNPSDKGQQNNTQPGEDPAASSVAPPSGLGENCPPKRKRGRPPKHAKAGAPTAPPAGTAPLPPPPPKANDTPHPSQGVKQSPRIHAKAQQIQSHSTAAPRGRGRRRKRRGRR